MPTLGTLTDTDATAGSDPIKLNARTASATAPSSRRSRSRSTGCRRLGRRGRRHSGSARRRRSPAVSLSETGNTTGETFTARLTDTNGVLSASSSGGAAVSPANGGTTLTISGSLTEVECRAWHTHRQRRHDRVRHDQAQRQDSFGNSATQQTIAVTVNGLPTIAVPGAQTFGVGQADVDRRGQRLGDRQHQRSETFTARLTDTNGVLSASSSGGAAVSPRRATRP